MQPRLVIGGGRGPAPRLGVAQARRDGAAIRGSQVTAGCAGHQGAVEVHAVFRGADLTRFVHGSLRDLVGDSLAVQGTRGQHRRDG